MGRIITAGVAGAIVYFVWGMLAWMAIPLHTPTIAGLPEEQAVAESLKNQNLETGVYIVPFTADSSEMSDPESDFTKNHTAGPIFSIYYKKDGATPMSGSMLLGGFVIDFLAAFLAAALLSCTGACCRGYGARVGFVFGLGVFTALIAHGGYWNWMYFPLDYTIAFMIDVAVGWLLAGLAIAYFVRPKEEVAELAPGSTAAVAEKPKATPAPAPVVQKPIRNDAISLLATSKDTGNTLTRGVAGLISLRLLDLLQYRCRFVRLPQRLEILLPNLGDVLFNSFRTPAIR